MRWLKNNTARILSQTFYVCARKGAPCNVVAFRISFAFGCDVSYNFIRFLQEENP